MVLINDISVLTSAESDNVIYTGTKLYKTYMVCHI